MARVRCPGNARHWFSAYGLPGLRRPTCVRCGAPNPRPLTPGEIANFEYAVEQGWTMP